MPRAPLPVDALVPEIVQTLKHHPSLVLEAPPGAGKTTRVPLALLEHDVTAGAEIIVLEPRRLATRLAARRSAFELGEPVGERVGYQVRMEDVSSPRTRLRFVTEALLLRRMLSNPTLKGVGAVVLDEFHERHLHTDVALALLTRLQRTLRHDLKIVVMSATLDAAPLAAYLNAPQIRSEGRLYEVGIDYAPRPEETPLAQQVARALARALKDERQGDVLVFLPGVGEIKRAMAAAEGLGREHHLLLLPLYGDLDAEAQDRAVRPADKRKVIFATNVAETSVTIDGVVWVIDSGLARVASHSAWSGLPLLKLAKISQSSAKQRAGRAGRTRPGQCLRLYTQHDYHGRPAHDLPEVQRLDMSETLLSLYALHAQGVTGPIEKLPWFDPPKPAAITAARELLTRLGALQGEALTELGRKMADLPLHPRLSRLLIEAHKLGAGGEGCTVAALLSERDIEARAPARGASAAHAVKDSDVVHLLERYQEAERKGFNRAEGLGLDAGALYAVKERRAQLARMMKISPLPTRPAEEVDEALRRALLTAYSDRVGQRRAAKRGDKQATIVLSGGGSAALDGASVVREAEWLCVIDAEERSDREGRNALIRKASAIAPDWLLDVAPLHETLELNFNANAERVEAVRRLSYDALTLDLSPEPSPDPERVSEVLFDAARAKGLAAFADAGEVEHFIGRVKFLRQHCPELGLPDLDEHAALRRLCEGARSFSDLRARSPVQALRESLPPDVAARLDALAPTRLSLPSGRALKVEYPLDALPFVMSRLQDFFGLAKGPTVANGRVPVTLHLLAPNQRAVQVTTDLAGFWQKHYPAIAKELRRRYPRHAWPDDPLHAEPPAPRRR